MNDILIETCSYIYKNPGLSRYRYIKEMSSRSIWKHSNVEDKIDYLSQLGILKEYKKYNSRYNKEYIVLEVDIFEYVKFYNIKFNNEIFLNVLAYIFNHPKKSCKTYEKDFSDMFDDKNLNKKYLDCFFKLRNNSVLKLKNEYFNDYKYDGLRIDFHELKSFVMND